jgi:acetyltransferase-like isoleucine patch superfamily enzyme
MNYARILQSLRICLMINPFKRAMYLRSKHIFGSVGESCVIHLRKIPLYPNLIRLHNNVRIAPNVLFVTHDGVHDTINAKNKREGISRPELEEKVGCIEIMDNVFIGAGTTILYDVRIGSNVVIGARSLVNKDLQSNGVNAGVPARYICSYEELERKRSEISYPAGMRPQIGIRVNRDLENLLWDEFEKSRLEFQTLNKAVTPAPSTHTGDTPVYVRTSASE